MGRLPAIRLARAGSCKPSVTPKLAMRKIRHEDPVRSELRRASSAAMTNNGVKVCPEAWYLRRFGHRPDAEAAQRLRQGTRAHPRIVRVTDQLVGTDTVR